MSELPAEQPPAEAARHPVRLVVTDDLRRSRLTVFFRLPLSFPHLVWWYLWGALAALALLANWLCALVIGRAPRPLARFLSAYLRYTTHVYAFLFLVGNPFPGFTGTPGSYPIDLELDPFAPQKRLVTLFRPLLAIPALIILYPASYLLGAVAFLGWFAALVRGRMPQGLRNCGTWALGYQAQANAYLYVLTDRYPCSSPVGTWRAG